MWHMQPRHHLQVLDLVIPPPPSIPEQVLFTLAGNAAAAGVAYLQVLIDLLPKDDESQGRFTGSVSQEILIVTTCS